MPKKLDWKRVNPLTDLRYEATRSSGSHDGFSVRVECRDPDDGSWRPMIFQGPKMRIPFGLEDKQTPGGLKYYCPLSFPTVKKDGSGEYTVDAENEDALGFLKFMKQIDESNKAAALLQCKTWFKKDMNPDVLNEFYYHNLNTPKEEDKYSPTLQSKLIHNGTDFGTDFWNQKREQIEYDSISKGLTVIPLIQTRGLWFAGKSFGMSLQVKQLVVFERDQFNGCAIDFDDGCGTPGSPEATIDLPGDAGTIAPPEPKRRKRGAAVPTGDTPAIAENFNKA